MRIVVLATAMLAIFSTYSSTLNSLSDSSIKLHSSTYHLNTLTPQSSNSVPPEVWITIFVHGIKSIKPHISLHNFFHFLQDNIENTVYAKTVGLMRQDQFFFKNQAMREMGLHIIDAYKVEPGNASSALARIFEELNSIMNIRQQSFYYTYGWCGLLSPSMRYHDAELFFESIEKEVKQYHSYGIYPKIRLIGYSHGGNVCLNLELARRRRFLYSKLKIDELVLLGSPIQATTDYLINGPLFEKVYNLYSDADRIQRLDLFSFNRLLSSRKFQARKDFTLPKKLIQIKLKVMRPSTGVTAGKKKYYNLSTCTNHSKLISGKSHLVRDASPGHCELWFFGWTPVHYRANFPLYPLPTIAFFPLIRHALQDIRFALPSPIPFVVDLRPDQEIMIIRPENSAKPYKITSLLTKREFNYIKNIAHSFNPGKYTPREYNAHIRLAYEHARIFHAQKNEKRNPMAFKNQKKISRIKLLRKKQRELKKHTKIGNINIALHREMKCPFCFNTTQRLTLFYRSSFHKFIKSSKESCCALKLKNSWDILSML